MTPRRLVLMRIDADTDADRVRETHASFEAIPGVRCAVAAERVKADSDAPRFTHLSMFEFADAAARSRYSSHPFHTHARDQVRSRLHDVVVMNIG